MLRHLLFEIASVAFSFSVCADEIRAVQLDLARQKEPVGFIKDYATRAHAVGYNTLVRYLADPARRPSVSREEKARLGKMLARWNELVVRREEQWKAWRGNAGSELKERLHASLPKLVRTSFEGVPDAIRITEKGYGAGALCHVSLRNRSRRLTPMAVLSVSGQVRDANNLLVDDFRETRFGDPDCTAAVLDPRLATLESAVTLSVK